MPWKNLLNMPIHVAIGVIFNSHRQVLVARRPQHVHLGGYWEFPGGKVEAGETVTAALIRELREELAIDIKTYQPFLTIAHTYSDREFMLDVWLITEFSGVAVGNEGQEIAWMHLPELLNKPFPEANQKIISTLLEWVEDTE
ncbi:MAG: 8-oxo-dGTP diphosphatase MutT [Legionellales bacterium]|nr:8-oxo-dGTP diphosphatase MutT [Legionellales bacterium]